MVFGTYQPLLQVSKITDIVVYFSEQKEIIRCQIRIVWRIRCFDQSNIQLLWPESEISRWHDKGFIWVLPKMCHSELTSLRFSIGIVITYPLLFKNRLALSSKCLLHLQHLLDLALLVFLEYLYSKILLSF